MGRAIFLVLGLSVVAPAGAERAPAKRVTAQDLSDDWMEAFLKEGKIVKSRGLSAGVTGSVRATLRREDVEHDAHIQSIDQTSALLRVGGGTELDFRDTFRHNVAAYRLDRLLGLGMTPVSVVRSFERKTSAFTWWVDDVAMTETERRDGKVQSPDAEAWNRQMYAVRIFDQLIYNFDRNLGNLLIDSSWRIWMIDHTRAFKIFKELKGPANLRYQCPRGLLEGLRRLDQPTLERTMKDMLTGGQIRALLARRDLIVKYFDRMIAELGEGEVLYDLPPRIKATPEQP